MDVTIRHDRVYYGHTSPHILLSKILSLEHINHIRENSTLSMHTFSRAQLFEIKTYIVRYISWRVECGNIFRSKGTDNFDPEEDACEDVNRKHGYEKKPCYLEYSGSEVYDPVVLYNPAMSSQKRPCEWPNVIMPLCWRAIWLHLRAIRNSLDHFDSFQDSNNLEDSQNLSDT